MEKIKSFVFDMTKFKFKRATRKQIDFLIALGIRAYLQEEFPDDPEKAFQGICESKSTASFYINEMLRLEEGFLKHLREQETLG